MWAQVHLHVVRIELSTYKQCPTKHMISRQPLQLPNQSLKRETPPRMHWPKETEKIIYVKGHMAIHMVIAPSVNLLKTTNPHSHATTKSGPVSFSTSNMIKPTHVIICEAIISTLPGQVLQKHNQLCSGQP
jgi:hypothetical protein